MTIPIEIIYLLDIDCYIDGVGVSTLHYGTSGYTSAAGIYYEPRIKQPGNIKQSMFQDGMTGGASQIGYGEVVLINNDGGLDALVDYGFDGRAITLTEVNQWGSAAVLVGTQEQPTFSWDEVAIRIKDKQADLNVPIQATKYLGNNSLPAGLEGVADIQGKPKPLAYGVCKNVSPVLVNTSKLTYQVNDGAVTDIPAVYDQGVSITKGSDYATGVLLNAATVGAGTYATSFAEGYFRLGSLSTGEVTADVTQGAATANRTTAQIVRQIVLRKITTSDLVEQGFIDTDAANSSEVSLYISDETTINDALNTLCASIGAWYGFNNLSKFDLRRMEIPTGNAIMTLDDSNILSIERVATNDDGRGVPAYQVVLDYDKNNTVQASGLAGAVTSIRRNYLSEEYRNVSSTDATVQTKHTNAVSMPFTSQLVATANAQTEADRLLTIYKARRDMLNVKCKDYSLQYDSAGWWDDKSISEMNGTKSSHASVVFGNYIYVIGGSVSSSVIRLDLSNPTGAWESCHDLPATRQAHSAVVFGNYIYVIGGTVGGVPSSSVIRLDASSPTVTTDTWDDAGVADLPSTRGYHASVIFGNYVYVLGNNISSSVIRLDLSNPTGAWDDAGVTDLPAPVGLFSAVVYGNYVYVFGGTYNGTTTTTSDVIRLDLTNPTGAWDTTGVTDLPITLDAHSAVLMGDYVYISGGFSNLSPVAYSSSVFRLDLSNPTGSWDDAGVADLPTVRMYHTSNAYGGHIYAIGGITFYSVPQSNTYMYRYNGHAPDIARLSDFGNVVNLAVDRFGYGSSKLMRIIGTEKNFETNDVTLTLWG